MPDLAVQPPVILIDGLLASGSSVISTYVGRSYAFVVINGNQYLRDLGISTGFVKAPAGTFEHEEQLLDFYEYIANQNAAVHDQMYSFLTNKVQAAKDPTIVHCTGYTAYALNKHLPIKQTFWLNATLDDRVERLLARHQLKVTPEHKEKIKEKLSKIDEVWETSLRENLGIDMHEAEKKDEAYIDTANMTTDQAFQKLATVDSFVDTYNSLAHLMPGYFEEWRRWQCLVCQLVVETNKVVVKCPRCNNSDPDKFRDLD